MTLNSVLCGKAIRFILNGIRPYTHPENIVIGENENGYNSSENTFSGVLKQRLDKIEDHQGFTLMEKVRLVFIFSRPVSPGFLKIPKDAKCVVKLNDERKITYFSSPDGTVFESKQSKSIPKENRKIISELLNINKKIISKYLKSTTYFDFTNYSKSTRDK
ncbi:hypothetical protein B9Z55_025990 [Caenorhabditis nigoni]|uniref:SPK domain-containing protein n=1 Tax=Caenorhabditis nigoni TaxID=1611254 RepID=A0A2G5T0S2_9PELO|nr:hypothetical protein B9Z55_025990 [Caenorhabditis nigoni]